VTHRAEDIGAGGLRRRVTARRVAISVIGAALALVAAVVATQTLSTSGRIGVVVGAGMVLAGLLATADPPGAVRGILRGYQRASDRMTEGLGRVAKWLVPTCVAVGFVNVLLRYIGRYTHSSLTSNRYIELQWMLFGAIFLVGFPYVLRHGINVRVDFVFQRFSLKVRALIDFAGHVVGLVPYVLFAIWASWDFALTSLYQRGERWGTWRVWDVWERSPDAEGLPRAPIKLLILLGFVFLAIQTLAELIRLGFVLGERDPLTEPDRPEAPLRIE
jgi:TRAP-type mannitol/chloroaromatic compound transport system permease small subunit